MFTDLWIYIAYKIATSRHHWRGIIIIIIIPCWCYDDLWTVKMWKFHHPLAVNKKRKKNEYKLNIKHTESWYLRNGCGRKYWTIERHVQWFLINTLKALHSFLLFPLPLTINYTFCKRIHFLKEVQMRWLQNIQCGQYLKWEKENYIKKKQQQTLHNIIMTVGRISICLTCKQISRYIYHSTRDFRTEIKMLKPTMRENPIPNSHHLSNFANGNDGQKA